MKKPLETIEFNRSFLLLLLSFINKNERDELKFQMIKNLLFNVNPYLDISTLTTAYGKLPLKQSSESAQTKNKIDLKKTWNLFLEEQNLCIAKKLGIKSLAMLMTELETIAQSRGLIVRKNRQIPGYLINISM